MRNSHRNVIGIAAVALAAAGASLGQVTARLTTTAAALQAKYGTSNIKVVFAIQNAPYYVDFSEATPTIHKVAGVSTAFLPTISSDGKWFTYQSGIDAESPYTGTIIPKVWMRELAEAGTPVKVADTGYVPRFIQNTPADAPEIIYSTSVACPGGICFNAGKTVKKKITLGAPSTVSAADVVFGGGSYYGGLSWDNKFLITGWEAGPNAFMLYLGDGGVNPVTAHSIHVRTAADKDTTIALGVCNISRSASRIFTNSMLYYDFGSGLITQAKCHHPILGTWQPHEKLFISNYQDQDEKVYSMPTDRPFIKASVATGIGEAVGIQWANPEWTNHPYFAVASLQVDRLFLNAGNYEHTMNIEGIYLINLKDSSYVKLVESTDTTFASKTNFGNPFGWVGVPDGFQEDSTWLAKTIYGTSGVIPPKSERAPVRNGFTLDKNITSVKIYSSSGRRLMVISAAGKTTSDFVKIFQGLRAGRYFIGLDAPGMKQKVVPWINPK